MTGTATIVPPATEPAGRRPRAVRRTMKATVFHSVGDIRIEEVARPTPDPTEAVIRVTLTTICGTDLHIVRGEYPVRPGLIIGHEPVGVIAELGSAELSPDRKRGARRGTGERASGLRDARPPGWAAATPRAVAARPDRG